MMHYADERDVVKALLLSVGDEFQFTIIKHRIVSNVDTIHRRLELQVDVGDGELKTFSTEVPLHYHELNQWLEVMPVSFVNELQLKRKTTCP